MNTVTITLADQPLKITYCSFLSNFIDIVQQVVEILAKEDVVVEFNDLGKTFFVNVR